LEYLIYQNIKLIIYLYSLNYNLFINIRVINKRTNLGKIYLLNVKTKKINKIKVKSAWFTKKNGINCGIVYYIYGIYSYIYHKFYKSKKQNKKIIIKKIYNKIKKLLNL
jgi:hypothetical protein